MVADKLYSDAYYRNTDYALVGGLPNAELNLLEHEFMAMVGFDLHITDLNYETYLDKLQGFAAVHVSPSKPPLSLCLQNGQHGDKQEHQLSDILPQ